MKKTLLPLISSLFLVTICFNSYGQKDSIILDAIKKENIPLLNVAINLDSIDCPMSDGEGNLLMHAIIFHKFKVVSFLLKFKVNPNYRYHARTPLMYAVQQKNSNIARILIKHGADINAIDSMGNTALMIAATNNKISLARLLIHKHASLNVRNKKGYNARDFAVRSNNRAMASYLSRVFEQHLPNYFDGPYIFYKGNRKIKISYLIHDSLRHRSDIYDSIYKISEINGGIMGRCGDHQVYLFNKKFSRPKSVLTKRNKLLIIGDIHGQYDTLRLFLIKNNVIDEKLNWKFGSGTIVFLGDIFDRGENVTNALWLIYRMEFEATKVGGEVQLLLGNHEMMVFQEDFRYISEKYFYVFKDLRLNYSKFYNNKSLLGRWLKSKNTILKIDTLLFVHGGIHPNIMQFNMSIDSINNLINKYVNNIKKYSSLNNPALQFLLSYNGPFWYRGMVEKSDEPVISEEELQSILNYYGVKHIFVGHTFYPNIKLFNEGKVISTDVPFYLPDGEPMEALLIENGASFLLNTSGNRSPFKLCGSN